MTPSGPLVERDHEQQRGADGEQDVREARDHERDGALLHPEQVRQLHVVQLRPERDRARANEVRGARIVEQPAGDLTREGEEDDQPERRHRHREPERRAQDEPTARVVLGIEVEAEERRRDPELEHDREHGDEGDQRLDLAVVRGREVVRVEGQQKDSEDPRDEAAEAVDRGVLAEPLQLAGERHQSRA